MSLNRLLIKRKAKKLVDDLAVVFTEYIYKYIGINEDEEIPIEELREVKLI